MSGIFKGDSIYKSGGGGGGFKDGGELVDGDFIKVENNTVSSYDNVSRDPVNFYFEVKDGEILNSVVELTTTVNATINVYVLKNGLYYLLGNVGGNTVNAGDDYKVNITGDSFSVEEVSGGLEPGAINIGGHVYGLTKINGLLWCNENAKVKAGTYLNFDVSTYMSDKFKNEYYYKPSSTTAINNYLQEQNVNCRLPTKNEFTAMCNSLGGLNSATAIKLKSTTLWSGQNGAVNGTNESGFNAYPTSYSSGGVSPIGQTTNIWTCVLLDATVQISSGISTGGNMSINEYYSMRFVIDLN